MKEALGNLSSALGLRAREHVALVGGGGKSTLLFALATELQQQGFKVVTTTTTKMWKEEGRQAPGTMYLPGGGTWEIPLKEAVEKQGHVFVSREVLASGKVAGIPKSAVDAIFQASWVDHLLVEADGAAGRPLKVPGPYEPVIPDSATVVIGLMGLDALGAPCAEENVFRIERFERITGLEPDSEMTPEALARIFTDPDGIFRGSPGKARHVAFLNKLDLLEDRDAARRLARYLIGSPGPVVDRVVLGSLHNEEYMILGAEQ